MWPIVTDGVAWSVCRSVTIVSPAKTAAPIEMLFGMWTRVDPRNRVLHGLQILTREGAILRAKRGPAQDMSGGRYTQSDSAGGRTGTVRMPIGVY